MAVNTKKVVVLGLGEVGKPLFQLISKHQEVVGIDVTPPAERITDVDVLHVCYSDVRIIYHESERCYVSRSAWAIAV